ncbi:MAG: hypothetical protein JWO37_310 [Acidimicrobiales bacterium]|nr:hypothetical protein [Acidimicrobiales bacterium]
MERGAAGDGLLSYPRMGEESLKNGVVSGAAYGTAISNSR